MVRGWSDRTVKIEVFTVYIDTDFAVSSTDAFKGESGLGFLEPSKSRRGRVFPSEATDKIDGMVDSVLVSSSVGVKMESLFTEYLDTWELEREVSSSSFN